MNKAAPSPARIIAMVTFAFSCFGLLLFLWLSFGGPVPLKPKGYRVDIGFPEATQLATQADVRVSGVPIGKVVAKRRDPASNLTLATIEIDRRYAPLRSDARATLRQKTLLGETFVELTLGTDGAPHVEEGGRLDNEQVQPSIEVDEVLNTFDPFTRKAFRTWQLELGRAVDGRGQDLNDALGNLEGFSQDGADLLTILTRRAAVVQDLVRNTGNVFEALTRDEDQLRAFIADTSTWLQATASQREALAESIQIFPTFLRESRSTLARLETFSADTKPLIDDLRPVARDLQPTLADLRLASPDLSTFFTSLPAAVEASEDGLPALSRVLRGLVPVLDATGPFLRQLNPVLQWLVYQQGTVANFVSMPGWALQGKASTSNPNSNGHILPQLIVAGSQTLVTPTRSPDNRGNTYFRPDALNLETYRQGFEALPAWDCNNTTGEHRPTNNRDPGCVVQGPQDFKDQNGKYARVLASDFSSGTR